MKRTLILSIAVLLAGCQTVWLKEGATQADLDRDSYNCEKDARQSGYFGSGLAGALNMRAFFERCMVAHGWRKQTSENGKVTWELAEKPL